MVPAKHPWARRKQIAPHELMVDNLLLLSAGDCLRDQVLEACARFARPNDSAKQGEFAGNTAQHGRLGVGHHRTAGHRAHG